MVIDGYGELCFSLRSAPPPHRPALPVVDAGRPLVRQGVHHQRLDAAGEGDVTIVKCGGECLDEYYLSTGTLTENTNYINMCRTQVRVKMNTPADYFLKNPLGNHHILLQGNYENSLNEFLMANSCKRTE